MRLLFGLILLLSFGNLMAQSPTIEFTTKNGTDREKAVIPRVQKLLDTYDLSRWIFTKKVIIEAFAIPHSHPVLTLNTKPNTEDELLSTFLHEQIHWYEDARPAKVNKAIEEFKTIYPEVPVGRPEGAKSEFSTYLHLIICYLEYQSMIALVGEERAKKVMLDSNHYQWIYDKVVNETETLARVVKKHGLGLLNQ